MSWPAIFDHKIDNLELIVFDLDGTLWYPCVTERPSPYVKASAIAVTDINGRQSHCYPEVPEVLSKLYSIGYKLAIASRAVPASDAVLLISAYGWSKYFTYVCIQHGGKIGHFQTLQAKSKIPYSKMLFFDDEDKNLQDVSSLGVICYQTQHPIGTTKQVVKNGIEKFNKVRNNASNEKINPSSVSETKSLNNN